MTVRSTFDPYNKNNRDSADDQARMIKRRKLAYVHLENATTDYKGQQIRSRQLLRLAKLNAHSVVITRIPKHLMQFVIGDFLNFNKSDRHLTTSVAMVTTKYKLLMSHHSPISLSMLKGLYYAERKKKKKQQKQTSPPRSAVSAAFDAIKDLTANTLSAFNILVTSSHMLQEYLSTFDLRSIVKAFEDQILQCEFVHTLDVQLSPTYVYAELERCVGCPISWCNNLRFDRLAKQVMKDHHQMGAVVELLKDTVGEMSDDDLVALVAHRLRESHRLELKPECSKIILEFKKRTAILDVEQLVALIRIVNAIRCKHPEKSNAETSKETETVLAEVVVSMRLFDLSWSYATTTTLDKYVLGF